MKTQKLLHLADLLANDLMSFAEDQGLTTHDLLMTTALAERLLQKAVCANSGTAVRAILEADATLEAVTVVQEPN